MNVVQGEQMFIPYSRGSFSAPGYTCDGDYWQTNIRKWCKR